MKGTPLLVKRFLKACGTSLIHVSIICFPPFLNLTLRLWWCFNVKSVLFTVKSEIWTHCMEIIFHGCQDVRINEVWLYSVYSLQGYYRRSENYFSIKEREILGCFAVAMVHSALLINLNHIDSQKIAYYPPPPRYVGPFDDIIVFAHSVNFANVKMYIFNEVFFGFVPLPMENHNTVAEEAEQFVHVKTDSIGKMIHGIFYHILTYHISHCLQLKPKRDSLLL